MDWKRRISKLYEEVRASSDPLRAWEHWRATRDDMFKNHPRSPIPQDERSGFEGLPVYEYRPDLRLLGEVEAQDPQRYDIATSGENPYSFTRFGTVHVTIEDRPAALELYWLDGYGGGIFLPFRDGTSGSETYGAGRYLLDTVKGADLGMEDGLLVLDFNFAYNPSCSYDPRWVCPLAPPPNRFELRVEAGERQRHR
jgi:uncharacterized protein (DUF1684 family)